jgi:hypothetical protein
MQLEMILSVAIGVWIAVLLLVVSLCHAAKRGDDALDVALANALATGPDAEATPTLSAARPLRTLTLYHAATLLGVDPDTVLTWEARYGYPSSSPSEPRYSRSEVLALRASLEGGLSIASAVISAREETKRRRAVTAERLVDRRDGGIAF